MKYLVAQIGSRMHYAVPRILQSEGLLDHLYTDITSAKGIPSLLKHIPYRLLPGAARRLRGREPLGVPKDKISSFPFLGIRKALSSANKRLVGDFEALNLQQIEAYCRLVCRAGFGSATHVYAFNSCALEIFIEAREKGLKLVLEQTIAPRRIERDLMRRAADQYPAWAQAAKESASAELFCQREEREWSLADVIVCGSHFVRESIARNGGPVDRCVVVPYGVDGNFNLDRPRQRAPGPLRALFVGTVGLRKGVPLVREVAEQLSGIAEFRLIGKLDCEPHLADDLRKYCDVRGVVPRSEIMEHYAWADVFVLPSFCEGSATVTYEAALAGLPVICTDNAGSMVVENQTGFVIPAFNAECFRDRVELLARSPERLAEMSGEASKASDALSESAYKHRLLQVLQNL